MRLKKHMALLLALLLTVQITGCGKKQESPVDEQAQETETIPENERAETGEMPTEETEIESSDNPSAVKWGEYSKIQEQIMRLKTGIYDRELTPEDLKTVEELVLDGEYIDETEWLGYLTNLKILKLPTSNSGQSMNNLNFLSSMSGLQELDLTGQRITDISGLSGLANLTALSMNCTQVEDLSVLSGLTKLTTLTLEKVKPEDLNVLSGLTSLTTLSLDFTSLSDDGPGLDLSGLSGLTNLTTLVLSGDSGRIKDLQFLSDMMGLTTLIISEEGRLGIDALDLGVLSGLTNLTILELGFNVDYEAMDAATGGEIFSRRYDISPLAALTNLKTLSIGYISAYMDLSVLSGLTNLTTLSLYSPNNIVEESRLVNYGGDLSVLSGLDNLSELILKGGWEINQIASIPALPSLTSLSLGLGDDLDSNQTARLDVAGVLYTTIDPVWESAPAPFPNLEQVTTLVILEGGSSRYPNVVKMFLRMPNVTTLEIQDGDCMDLAVGDQSEWPNVTTLVLTNGTLGGMSVSGKGWDAGWNAKVPNVTTLTLNHFSGDLSALSGLSGLTTLTLNGCQGGMDGRLAGLPNLMELRLNECKYTTTAGLSDMTNLVTYAVQGEGFISSGEEDSPYSYHALAGAPNLKTVEGVFQGLEAVSSLPKLETITFPYGCKDASELYKFPDLSIIW